jgi:chaperonin GroEL (HSP60 family)
MRRRRPRPTATLDDVVEVLTGIGRTLMSISARLDDIAELLEGEDDEEADA